MNDYSDIINLPHYELKYHNRMPLVMRAAQFAPYAALSGYEEEVRDAGRYIYKKIDLTDEASKEIDNKLRLIENNLGKDKLVTIKYYSKDKYITYTGVIKKIDIINRIIVLTNKYKIYIDSIVDIKL